MRFVQRTAAATAAFWGAVEAWDWLRTGDRVAAVAVVLCGAGVAAVATAVR
jgi:hypothetical protein